MAGDTRNIETIIDYHFRDEGLLTNAVTHASWSTDREACDNERLEFIGDAVINLIVAFLLFEGQPDKDEGWLSRMRSRFVDEECLAAKARQIGLGDYLLLGKGESTGGGREKPSILSGAYEALMGAVFIDGGYNACEAIIRRHFEEIRSIGDEIDTGNYKSLLQERLQKQNKLLPRYEVIEISGPDHDRVFLVAVFVEGLEWGRGLGKSKKEAEQEAARMALLR